jgi:adenine deaminase
MAQRADIVVVGDRVVVPHAAVPPSALRVDVRGKYLVPGLSGWARAF